MAPTRHAELHEVATLIKMTSLREAPEKRKKDSNEAIQMRAG